MDYCKEFCCPTRYYQRKLLLLFTKFRNEETNYSAPKNQSRNNQKETFEQFTTSFWKINTNSEYSRGRKWITTTNFAAQFITIR